VGFAVGGVVDAVAEGQSGYLVRSGDYAAFADTVLHALSERGALRSRSIDFARRFAWPMFGSQIAGQLGLANTVEAGDDRASV
jgi:phosphatidylinositol alpha-1,6-mannosyltransferase